MRYCCDQKITLEPYRKPRAYKGTQCHNCLRYGHVAKYCGMSYRCIKCSLSHEYGKCMKSKEDKPKCANCGSTDHVGNYKGCIVAKTYVKKIDEMSKHTHSHNNNKNFNTKIGYIVVVVQMAKNLVM